MGVSPPRMVRVGVDGDVVADIRVALAAPCHRIAGTVDRRHFEGFPTSESRPGRSFTGCQW